MLLDEVRQRKHIEQSKGLDSALYKNLFFFYFWCINEQLFNMISINGQQFVK